ncbi:MAG: hypothetical protein IT358_04770 [Gemmatimonadaceae bacterium]|mgnify:CR=1 FL=1|jgi:hypothetical protein|nr:hypothetical protein [Gemmatimonadota bacterium]MBP9107211.1 hypothetical protein [Gemmatimonadaceae bacterium]MBK6841344.1 hypothetical protein [Gemmatimonadota bacterium]MBK7835033.1 hypothetical protein [Gemmatimonadota bacterium]MBK8061445.1 hypothetical protein [Gemmatimonadota bacterium]
MARFGWAVLLLAIVACGEKKPKDPVAAKVADAIPQLEKSTGLTFKTPPKFEARTKEEVRAFLEKRFAEDMPDEELKGSERSYKRLGLLPDSLDLRKFMLALLTEQIAGYYDPATKVLYIVQGASDEMVSVTVSHELVHALQDQYLNLDSLQKVKRRNDRQLAAQSVIEGQATFEQLASMLGSGTMVANLPGGWDRVRTLIRENNSTMPIFSSAPTLVQETLLFPYLSGAEFIRYFKEKRAGKSVFESMPVSTEQVMHDDRFFVNRDDPTVVTLPAPTGKVVYENDLGEFETRLFLYEHLKDRDAAYRGAAGWDGDRYVLFDTPKGEGLAWVTVWDTSVDAAEFFDLIDTSILKRFGNVKPAEASQMTRVYSARGRTIAVTAGDVDGRPVVLYVDVPAGASIKVLDLSKVTLEE